VTIAYATTGATEAIRETRCRTLCVWTREELADLGLGNWASVFRFHPLAMDTIYDPLLFEETVWYRPDKRTALRLLD
jgi:hypothetical protein